MVSAEQLDTSPKRLQAMAAGTAAAGRPPGEGVRHLAGVHVAGLPGPRARLLPGPGLPGLPAGRQDRDRGRQPAGVGHRRAGRAVRRRRRRWASTRTRWPGRWPTSSTTRTPSSWSWRTRSRWTRSSRCGTCIPKVRYLVYYDPKGLRTYTDPWLLYFPQVMEMGREYGRRAPGPVRGDGRAPGTGRTSRSSATPPARRATPRAAMLSHRNLLAMGDTIQTVDPLTPDDDFLSSCPWPGSGSR